MPIDMRVLVVSQYFWPENFRINAIVESLVERGIEVDVLTGKPNYPEGNIAPGYRVWGCQQETWKGSTLHRVPLIPRGNKSRIGLSANYLSFVLFGSVMGAWMLRKQRFDVIFVYAPSPILAAIPALFVGWLKGTKVVTWVQDLWPESLTATGYVNSPLVLSVIRYFVRLIYRHSDCLLVQSRAFEPPVRQIAPQTPILYYPNSVDAFFSEPVKGETPAVDGFDGGFSVMFAGNIGAAQGVDVIVKAAMRLREYSDIHFVVMGDGSQRKEMMRLADSQGLDNIHFPGRFPVESMPGFMQKASVLLVTLTDQPIFSYTVPNKIQAYLAAGRPIVASLNGEGARLVVESGAGIAAPAEDDGALAEAVLSLYRMSDRQRKTMSEKGRLYYQQNFDHDRLVSRLVEHFETI